MSGGTPPKRKLPEERAVSGGTPPKRKLPEERAVSGGTPPKQPKIEQNIIYKPTQEQNIQRFKRLSIEEKGFGTPHIFENPKDPKKCFRLQWKTGDGVEGGMEHILKRHTYDYHDGSKKEKQSMFPPETKPNDIKNMIKEVVENPKSKTNQKSELGTDFQQIIGKTNDGTKLVVGAKRSSNDRKPLDIVQAYPLGEKYEVKVVSPPRASLKRNKRKVMWFFNMFMRNPDNSESFKRGFNNFTYGKPTLQEPDFEEWFFPMGENAPIVLTWSEATYGNSDYDGFEKKYELWRNHVLVSQKENSIFTDFPSEDQWTSYQIIASSTYANEKVKSKILKVGTGKIANLHSKTDLANKVTRLDWSPIDQEIIENEALDKQNIEYRIYCNEQEIGRSKTPTFENNQIDSNQIYQYTISAYFSKTNHLLYSRPIIVDTDNSVRYPFSVHTYLLSSKIEDLDDFEQNPEIYYTSIMHANSSEIIQRSTTTWNDGSLVEMVEGHIDIQCNGLSLIPLTCFDNVRVLWDYLLKMVEQYLEQGQATIYFPDQPIPFSLRKKNVTTVVLQIDHQYILLDEKECVFGILKGAEQFFTLLNKTSSGKYSLLLQQIEEMQNKVQSVMQPTLYAEQILPNEIQLRWTPVYEDRSAIKTYEIYLCDVLLDTLPGNAISYVHTIRSGLCSEDYNYKIVARGYKKEDLETHATTIKIAKNKKDSFLHAKVIPGNKIELDWTAAYKNHSSLQSYKIFRDGVLFINIPEKKTTRYIDGENLAPGKHVYEIVVFDDKKNVVIKDDAEIRITSTPDVPHYLRIKINDRKKIEMDWEFLRDIPSIQEFRIVCKDMLSISLPKECKACAFDMPYPGRHKYQLQALDSDKNIVEMHTAEITVINDPIASQFLQVKTTTQNERILNWTRLKSHPSIQNYRIYRDNDLIDVLPKNITEYIDIKELALGRYVYRVEALGNDGVSFWMYATEIRITKDPYAPHHLQIEAITPNKLKLNWAFLEDLPDIHEYKIYRNNVLMGCIPIGDTQPIDAICIPKEITDLTDLTWLALGKYTYRVEALDRQGRVIETSTAEIEVTEEDLDMFQTESTTENEIGLVNSFDGNRKATEDLDTFHLKAKSTESNKIKLSWGFLENSLDIQTYRIYRNDDLVGSVVREVTKFKDTTQLLPGEYIYRLETLDNEERVMNEYRTKIVVKENIEAKVIASNKIKLNWEFLENSLDIQTYRIYRNDVLLHQLPKETTQYIDRTKLDPGKYIYKVLTFDHKEDIIEIYSARINFVKAPDFFHVLQVDSMTPNKIKLSWKSLENPDIQEYKIYRNTHLVGVASQKITKFTDEEKLIPGKYIYRLETLDDEIAKVEVEALPLQIKLSQSNEIKLNWGFLENIPDIQVQTYKIYRNDNLLASVVRGVIEFIDQKLVPGEYIYRLELLDNKEEIISTYSSEYEIKSQN